jgi:hypothetical protein
MIRDVEKFGGVRSLIDADSDTRRSGFGREMRLIHKAEFFDPSSELIEIQSPYVTGLGHDMREDQVVRVKLGIRGLLTDRPRGVVLEA